MNHTELELNYDEINSEYNEIINRIDSEIKAYINNKKNNNGTDRIIFKFNKTICQKGLLVNDFEFVKDEFEMIIFPLTFEINALNPDFIETEHTIQRNIELYIYKDSKILIE